MAMNYDPLNRALAGVTTPVYATSFEDVSKGFKEKFGARGWTSELAKEIAGTSDKHSAAYKSTLRNVQRYDKFERGQGGQGHNPARASEAIRNAIADAGKTVDPIRKDTNGQGVTIEITFRAPAEAAHRPRERTAIIEMGGPELFDYVNGKEQPEYADLFDLWFDDGGEAYGEDGAYEVEVTGVSIS